MYRKLTHTSLKQYVEDLLSPGSDKKKTLSTKYLVLSVMTYNWPVPLFATVVQDGSVIKNEKSPLPVTPQIRGTFWEVSLFDGLNLNY